MTDTYTIQAIKKAVEGGWRPKHSARFMENVEGGEVNAIIQVADHFALDPSFWQALGRVEGWGDWTYEDYMKYPGAIGEYKYKTWHWHQHRLLDHINEGESIESYFKELLTPSNK